MKTQGFVAQANSEIRAAQEAHEHRKSEQQRVRRPIELMDGLINDLEVLNLRGAARVPISYEPRLLQIRVLLRELVSSDQLDNLRARVRTVKLMDELYAVEETLFASMRVQFDDDSQASGLYPAA